MLLPRVGSKDVLTTWQVIAICVLILLVRQPIPPSVFLCNFHESSRVIGELVKTVGRKETVDIRCVVPLVMSDALAHAALVGQIEDRPGIAERDFSSTKEVLVVKINAESRWYTRFQSPAKMDEQVSGYRNIISLSR
jgi:hypothetical protein